MFSKERRRGFSNRSSVDAAMSERSCVFLDERKSTFFGLTTHLGIIKITYNRTAQPRCYHNAFYGRPFHEPRRGGNSDFAMTIWRFSIFSDCVFCLSTCYWLFKCGVLRIVCVCGVLVVFGQSQCTGSVGQSEQTVLVGRRDFIEMKRLREAGHRGPTIMYSIWKSVFFNIKACQHILLFMYEYGLSHREADCCLW